MEEETFSVGELKTENFLGRLSDLLLQEVTEPFFQELLDFTLSVIPNAQAGSVMLLQENCYHYVSVQGYDLQGLQQATMTLQEATVLAEPYQTSFILNDFEDYNQLLLDVERQEVLKQFGRVNEIKETLLIPVLQHNTIVAMLFLDNFEQRSIFTKAERATAEHIGLYLGLAARIWNYKKQLEIYEQPETAQTAILSEQQDCSHLGLSPRDKDVLMGIEQGLTNKEISKELNLATTTVKEYVKNLYGKIGVHSRQKAREFARNHKQMLK